MYLIRRLTKTSAFGSKGTASQDTKRLEDSLILDSEPESFVRLLKSAMYSVSAAREASPDLTQPHEEQREERQLPEGRRVSSSKKEKRKKRHRSLPADGEATPASPSASKRRRTTGKERFEPPSSFAE